MILLYMTELVPLDYDRNTHNTIHDTELRGHNDALTAEQAGLINQSFDIQLCFGSHGIDGQFENEVLDGEYEAVKSVVEGMKHGDVLFIEGRGFTQAVMEPIYQDLDEILPRDSLLKEIVERSMARSGINNDMVKDYRQKHQDWLDKMRQQQKISAWQYVAELARRKGIHVVAADLDAFDNQNAKELGFKDPEKNAELGQDEQGQWLDDRVDAWRERTARNIVKDWALDHLPPRPLLPSDDKPKLVVLFGSWHSSGLKQAFNELGLETTEKILDMTERAQETAQRVPGIVKTMGELGTRAPSSSFKKPGKIRPTSARALWYSRSSRGIGAEETVQPDSNVDDTQP